MAFALDRKLHTRSIVFAFVFCIFQILYTARGIFHPILLLSAYVTLVVVVLLCILTNSSSCLQVSACVCVSVGCSRKGGGAQTTQLRHFHARPHMCCTHVDSDTQCRYRCVSAALRIRIFSYTSSCICI